MTTVNIHEAKTHLSRLLTADRAILAAGLAVVVTYGALTRARVP